VAVPAVLTRALEVFRPSREVAVLREQVAVERNNNELLAESVADLERALAEPGWIRFLNQADLEFTNEGLVQLRAICRLYAIKNPLIKRGLALRSAYVWGQGVEVTARANGKNTDNPTEQDVQAVISSFLEDPANKRTVTGPEARNVLESSGLGAEGEVFIACFTRPDTGQVQLRTLAPDEIVDVICDPEDESQPWFYLRRWTRQSYDYGSRVHQYEVREQFYPCIDYRPRSKPVRLGAVPVAWDAPVLHVAVNRQRGWKRGVPDAYAAIDWAKAYKEFLEDWARLMKSLARYAWKATTSGSKATAVKARIAQPVSTSEVTGKPLSAGATALMSPDTALEAVSKSGATLDAESGRPIAMMVASALGVPVTMLLADPGQTGARATAETLDQPTELEMTQRRELWGAAYQRLFQHVILESARAPKGVLKGTVVRDDYGRETVTLDGDTDQTVDLTWPDLDDTDVGVLVKAIVEASGTGVVPPQEILRLLLTALGVRHVDQLVEAMLDDNGEFVWPNAPPIGPAGLGRAGSDPAGAGPGSMLPDGEEPDDDEDEDDDE
jgi:hypothetical protein